MKQFRVFSVTFLPTIILICVFALLSVKSLPDYGINWDSSTHFIRGQIYLRYFLTGKKDPAGMKKDLRTSVFNADVLNWAWTEKMTIGHPPVSDILEAATNRIVWGKLGLVGDIQSYHLFVVAMSVFMAAIVGIWSYLTFGPVASFFSVLSLVTIPFFFAEQHFNIKDPPVAAYYTGALFFLWFAAEYRKIWPVLVSGVFFGLALGTKFNIVFSILILIPWAISLRFWEDDKLKKIAVTAFIVIPVIAYGIFFISYPALWSAPIQKTLDVVKYYQTVSAGISGCPYYKVTIPWFFHCSDWTVFVFFATTIPAPTLILFILGFIVAWKHAFNKSSASFLWILGAAEPILRAVSPIVTLYGGQLRQIMEYIVPVSLLCGLAVSVIAKKITTKWYFYLVPILIVIAYIPVIFTMIRIHPNENVFYNELIGGLRGAMKFSLEGANNTYGNVNKQGADWLNGHAEKGAELEYDILANMPRMYFRDDFNVLPAPRDLYAQGGEYFMWMAYPGLDVNSFFVMRFARSFLKPVHLISVEGVPLLYIWKNDPAHTAAGIRLDKEVIIPIQRRDFGADRIRLTFEKHMVKRLEFYYTNSACQTVVRNMLVFATADRKIWYRLQESPMSFVSFLPEYKPANDIYEFAGEHASGIELYIQQPTTACPQSDIAIKLIGFP